MRSISAKSTRARSRLSSIQQTGSISSLAPSSINDSGELRWGFSVRGAPRTENPQRSSPESWMDEGAREEMLPVCCIDDSRERARVDFAEIERMIPDHLGIESCRSMPDHLAD